ncbi:MAG: hypothetical protein WKG03_14130 [Telluria sp.]
MKRSTLFIHVFVFMVVYTTLGAACGKLGFDTFGAGALCALLAVTVAELAHMSWNRWCARRVARRAAAELARSDFE